MEMKMQWKRLLALLAAVALVFAASACDDDKSEKKTDVSEEVLPDVIEEVDEEVEPDVTEEVEPDVIEEVENDVIEEVEPDAIEEVEPDVIEETTDIIDEEVIEIPTVNESCDEASLSACFANSDCDEDFRCQNIAAGEEAIACCVQAPRGTGITGDACSSENECASGLCIEFNDNPYLCADECDPSADECPEGFFCHGFMAVCVPDQDDE